MGKYDDLISQINRDVSTNGKKQNTGAKLNAVLNEMVSVLGDGYRIAGAIYPDSTAPTDPENGMCYIARNQGVYVNFGETTVGNGEIAFIYFNGTSWAKMGWSRNDYGLVVIS